MSDSRLGLLGDPISGFSLIADRRPHGYIPLGDEKGQSLAKVRTFVDYPFDYFKQRPMEVAA